MAKAAPTITVRLIGTLRTLIGTDEVHLALQNDDTISSLLHRLVEKYPVLKQEIFDKKGELQSFLNIIIDNKPLLKKNLSALPIRGPATLTIMMAIGGGQDGQTEVKNSE